MKSTVIHTIVFIILISLSVFGCVGGQENALYTTTVLDSNQVRNVYRSIRDFTMWMIRQTVPQPVKGSFLPRIEGEFPCNLTNMRSSTIPTSVHRLRPGKIIAIQTLLIDLIFQCFIFRRH